MPQPTTLPPAPSNAIKVKSIGKVVSVEAMEAHRAVRG
jgi:hypothetical protein